MAYLGTTAATTLQNPPILLARGMGSGFQTTGGTSAGVAAGTGVGHGLWMYASTNSSTEVLAANFFSDGFYLGMKAGDIVMCAGATGSSALLCIHTVASASTSGVSLSSAGGVTSTFA
jgi:tetrahydromethanopterin S-methyltransferase subunit D